MYAIVDILASAYGWARAEILDTICMDEAWYYTKLIKKRTLLEYKMQVGVAHNDPKQMLDAITEQERLSDLTPDRQEEETLDKDAFRRLIGAMSNNPRVVIKTTGQ